MDPGMSSNPTSSAHSAGQFESLGGFIPGSAAIHAGSVDRFIGQHETSLDTDFHGAHRVVGNNTETVMVRRC